ncbi:MAG: hypothetical protein AAB906_05105 [Patescibacteria group bacterium]
MPIEKEVKSASGRTKTIKTKKAVAVLAPEKKEVKKIKPAKTAIRKTSGAVAAAKKVVKKTKKEVNIKIEVTPKPISMPAQPSIQPQQIGLSPEQFNNIIEEEESKDDAYGLEEKKTERSGRSEAQIKDRSIGLYRKISFAFVFLTVALLAIVFYFSFIKVDISLTTNQERINSNLIFDVIDEEKNEIKPGSVGGIVKEMDISESKDYKPVTSEVIGEEVIGKAVIHNNYAKNQPLVASTRLMSADNKLYRIKNTVNIPAGGSAEVEIYADTPSEFMVVGPTKFTIPGLWAGLQDQIYAENAEPTVYQKQVKGVIGQADIDEAVKDLRNAVLEKAKIETEELGYDQEFYTLDENSVSIEMDGKVGEEKESFKAEIKAKVIAVMFDGNSAKGLAQEKINSNISGDKEISQLDADDIVYSLNNYDLSQGIATMNASFDGKVVLKGDAEILEKNKIVGLTKDQLEQYLGSLPEISGYEVKFWPSFIDKVPNLINVDRIKVEIQN